MTTATAVIGATKRLTFTFKNVAGTVTEPTSIKLKIREPDGVVISKTDADMGGSAGVRTYDHAVTKVGRHYVHVDGDGAVEAADQSIEFYALTEVKT